MSEIVVAYARPDEDAAARVIGKLEKLGFKVTPSLAGRPRRGRLAASAAPTVVLWSHNFAAARSGPPTGTALLARLDSAQPSPLLRAKAFDLRQWRGRDDHRGWRSLLASVQTPVVPAKAKPAAKAAAKAATSPVVAPETEKKGSALGAIIGWTIAGLVVAASGAAAVLFLF